MNVKKVIQANEAYKRLFIKMHIELNQTVVGGSNTQKLMREIEDVISIEDPETGVRLKNVKRGGSIGRSKNWV